MKSIPLLLSVFILAGCCTSAPAPVAPAPAPVAQAEPFDAVIYFNFDRSDLTGAAQAVINEIVSHVNSNGGSVSLEGHTDTSGSGAYNQGLSERRISSVASALASAGVSVGYTSAKGETDLAKETADGVREPLNRRVEVSVN